MSERRVVGGCVFLPFAVLWIIFWFGVFLTYRAEFAQAMRSADENVQAIVFVLAVVWFGVVPLVVISMAARVGMSRDAQAELAEHIEAIERRDGIHGWRVLVPVALVIVALLAWADSMGAFK